VSIIITWMITFIRNNNRITINVITIYQITIVLHMIKYLSLLDYNTK